MSVHQSAPKPDPNQNIEQQIDRILDDLWSSAAVDTINTIQKTKPKNSTYVSDNFWQAKSALLALISKQITEASESAPIHPNIKRRIKQFPLDRSENKA